MNALEITKLLSRKKFYQLFLTSSSEIIDKVWQKGNGYNSLFKLIKSDKTPLDTKFFAAEILYYFKKNIPEEYNRFLGKAYVNALKCTSMRRADDWIGINADAWGGLYEMDHMGWVGKHLFNTGVSSIPFLVELLDNDTPIMYEGSEGARSGNSYGYLIKDISAYYLSKITGFKLDYVKDRDLQDEKLEKLKIYVLSKFNIVTLITIDFYEQMRSKKAKLRINITKKEEIDSYINLLKQVPVKGNLFKKLSSKSTLYLVRLYNKKTLLKDVKIFNNSIQMPDTAFLHTKDQAEEEFVNKVKIKIQKGLT